MFWLLVSLAVLYLLEEVLCRGLEILKPIPSSELDYYLDQLRLYAQILASIFSIYFATIGIILSSGHSKLRRDIVWLLTSEQVGSNYSKSLVFSASFCVAATALPMLGLDPGYLVYCAATILTLATSLTLFPLGQRLFNFFDLNPLIRSEILPRISKHIAAASNPRISKSLANHHSLQARRLFEQMTYIDDRITSDVSGWDASLPNLTEDYTELLIHYLEKKPQIDPKSYWFPRRQRHRQWFYAGDTVTTMALCTSSQLTPEEEADLDWLEKEIIGRLKNHVELAVEARKYNLALKLLGRLSSRIAVYAKGFHFEIGMNEIKELRNIIERSLLDTSSASLSNRKSLIYLCDTWAALGGSLCLESMRRMLTFEQELVDFFEANEWTTDTTRQLPAFLQAEVSFISRRIKFEIDVEGQRLSQPKYLKQLVVQRLLRTYSKILPEASEFHQKEVPDFARGLIKSGLIEEATQVLLANLHSYWKFPQWLEQISGLLNRYTEYEHYSEEQYKLERPDVLAMASSYATAKDEVTALLSGPEIVQHLMSYSHDDDLPDQFGHAYYTLAEECILALQENNAENLKRLVQVFIPLAILAADHKFVQPDSTISTEFRLHLISTVLQDLASVVGYSIIYSEYYGNPDLQLISRTCFRHYVSRVADKKAYLTRMLRLSDTNSFSWGASPRNIIRIEWRMAFERQARQDGYFDRMGFERGRAHTSDIINEFLSFHSEASDLFFALEVLPALGKVDFKIDWRITHLAKKLSRKTNGEGEAE
ncbi:hypothetical protein FY156_07435 [Agrobacterium tumefaciens]|nr:hypothetical protein FY156_07435 [Agrobacterium tumefaciens]